jgi:hypothetical protein
MYDGRSLVPLHLPRQQERETPTHTDGKPQKAKTRVDVRCLTRVHEAPAHPRLGRISVRGALVEPIISFWGGVDGLEIPDPAKDREEQECGYDQ